MPDPDEENPYEKPDLREAWAEGYRAGLRGMDIPGPHEKIYDGGEKELAWIKGYTRALVAE